MLAWVLSSGWRAGRADHFMTASEAALDHQDYGRAYQQAKFAEAVYPSDAHRLAAGATAYLAGHYQAAADYFRGVGGRWRENGQAAGALAAAQARDRDMYEKLAGLTATNPISANLLSAAALTIGDTDRLAKLCTCLSHSSGQALATGVGLATENPDEALQALSEKADSPTMETLGPAFARLVADVSGAPDDSTKDLQEVVVRLVATTNKASRRAELARYLNGHGYPVAAEAYAFLAVRNEPRYRDGWNTLAAVQIGRQEYKDAERSLHTSVQLDEAFAETWHLKAELAKAQGKSSDASDYAAKAKLLGYQES